MRVVHLMQSATRVYGAERCILLEIAALRRRGHDARVLMLRELRQGPEGDVLTQALLDQGVPVESVPVASQVSARLLFGLVRALRRLRPDLVQAHGLKTDVLGFLSTRPLRVPLLCEVHGWLRPEDDRVVQFYEALDRRVLRHCEGALVLSTAYQAELRGLGVPHVYLLPSGLDIDALQGQVGRRDLRAELGLAPERPLVGIVGRLSPEKGHGSFLRALAGARAALASAPGEGPVGVLFGDGPLREELQVEARRLGLGEAVRFQGYVAEVADAYRAMDVLVSCSRYEGLPLNLIEAMALARPVLSMATGGCADIVAPEETGLLVPRGDERALTEGLVRLLRDAGLRQRLGAAGERRARARYSLEGWAAGAEGVYEDVLRRLARPGRAAA